MIDAKYIHCISDLRLILFYRNLLAKFDVFEESKQASFLNSYQPTSTLTSYLKDVICKLESGACKASNLGFLFAEFMQVW